MTTLDHAMHDLALARFVQSKGWGDNSAHVAKLAARVAELQALDNAAKDMTEVTATLKRLESKQGVIRTTTYLVPTGPGEYLGTGRDWGYLMEDGKRSRRL